MKQGLVHISSRLFVNGGIEEQSYCQGIYTAYSMRDREGRRGERGGRRKATDRQTDRGERERERERERECNIYLKVCKGKKNHTH